MSNQFRLARRGNDKMCATPVTVAVMTDRVAALNTILTEVHNILQHRLAEIGAPGTAHILMAIGPHGMALVRTNVAPEEMKAMSRDLGNAADGAMQLPQDNEQLN